METKELGKTGEKIAEIGSGTWQYRGGTEPLRLGVSMGASVIDTAEMYGTENVVGNAIGKIRNEVFIATKVSPQHLRYDDMLKAAENSRKRLRINTIDLYQIHWPNPSIPIRETMRAMEELIRRGWIRYIGVSNFSMDQLKEAQESLTSHEIVSNQVEYNLIQRSIGQKLLPYCKIEKILIIAYSPLARGKIVKSQDPQLTVLDSMGETYGRNRAQIALNWLLSQEGVMAIPKADRVEHIRENCNASGWYLSSDDAMKLGTIISHQ